MFHSADYEVTCTEHRSEPFKTWNKVWSSDAIHSLRLLSSLQGQCTVMSLTSPSSNCRRTIVWRSSRGSGGMEASAQKRRTTVPKVCLWLILVSFASSTLSAPHFLLPPVRLRSGYGEHRRHLRGAGVRPAGGYLHGSAGVCLDVEACARKWGERGLSNLHLLCLPLPSLAPSPSWSCSVFPQCTALTGSVAPSSSSSSSSSTISTKPKIYLTFYLSQSIYLLCFYIVVEYYREKHIMDIKWDTDCRSY